MKPKLQARYLLPIAFLSLSIVMTLAGEHRRMKAIEYAKSQFSGGLHEPMPEAVATERFLDYAINAPAWAAAWTIPISANIEFRLNPTARSLFYGRIMRNDTHWWYFVFLVLMWFSIGASVDRWRFTRRSGRHGATTLKRLALASFLVSYGAFVVWTGWRYREWEYGDRFINCVYVWGAALMITGTFICVRLISFRPAAHSARESES